MAFILATISLQLPRSWYKALQEQQALLHLTQRQTIIVALALLTQADHENLAFNALVGTVRERYKKRSAGLEKEK